MDRCCEIAELDELCFKALTKHFYFGSDQDPGGLLLLPEKGKSTDLDVAQVLSVMETLLLVASREVVILVGFLVLFPYPHPKKVI